ncbi:MAG: DUF222 domain-containing protein [Actinomycetales bacterium]
MFESAREELTQWVERLATLSREVSDEERVSRLRLLEDLTAAAAAAQARDAADLDASRRRQQAAAGAKVRRGEGVAAEVALARRVSPHTGARLLGLAKVLTTEMPHTLALMTSGQLSEWRATILARETACLELADRQAVDVALCSGEDPVAVGLSDRALAAAAKKLALQQDAASVVARAAKAEGERCVTIRPAPDAMTWVSALLPVADGVAVYAALKLAADTARSAPGGQPRSRGQLMADTLVQRVTGRDPLERPVDVDLQVVISDAALLAGGHEPASVEQIGPVPAPWVRRLVERVCRDEQARVFVRQLYAGPHGGLVGLASKARLAPAGLAELIQLRDQLCRTPWCGAPVRHVDHLKPWDTGGATEEVNLQGLCERCNYARQAPGWSADLMTESSPRGRPRSEQGRHVVDIVTPSGHRYPSVAPTLPPPARDEAMPEWFRPVPDAGFADVVVGVPVDLDDAEDGAEAIAAALRRLHAA